MAFSTDRQCKLPFLFGIFLSCIHLVTSLPIDDPTAFRVPDHSKPQCYSSSSVLLAPSTDCTKALAFLPTDPTNATFHQGWPRDPYLLPRYTQDDESGNCQVVTSMVLSGTKDVASWRDIKAAAAEVVSQCVDKGTGRTGGYVNVGKGGEILVLVSNVDQRAGLTQLGTVPIIGTRPEVPPSQIG